MNKGEKNLERDFVDYNSWEKIGKKKNKKRKRSKIQIRQRRELKQKRGRL